MTLHLVKVRSRAQHVTMHRTDSSLVSVRVSVKGIGFDHRRVIEGQEDVVDVQPVTSPTVLNTTYQEVMLWNGQFGNEIGGVVNVGIDPDRHFTEGTFKETNLRNLSGLETRRCWSCGTPYGCE